jgi:hypothetical protein
VCVTIFFTDFVQLQKLPVEILVTVLMHYAVVYGVSCRQIECTSAFSNLAGTEKVFVVL